MRKIRRTLGFTMAEMLIVVAIIAVLGGVAFIAVQNHQRSMAQLERNAIAKELFIAAQNHLTMAESEGYPVSNPGNSYFGATAEESSSLGTVENATNEDEESGSGDDATAVGNNKPSNVYYVIGPASGNILDLMLPFGSIDETVRAGGSYLIRYQTNPALVLDVFYVTTSGNPARFNKDGGIKDDEYSDLMKKRSSLPSSGYVLGYYGGEQALESGEIILAPTVEVHNEERLTVTVTDLNNNNVDPTKRNANAALKLIITGETSGAKMAIALDSSSIEGSNMRFSYSEQDLNYTVVLDDITTAYDEDGGDGLHFGNLNSYATSEGGVIEFWKDGSTTPTFLPGENITVQAVAYSNTALTNIAYSSARTTNSLFADPGETATTAMISNFRHLENLDASISGLDSTLGYTAAEQIADLTWIDVNDEDAGFVAAIRELKDTVKIYMLGDATGGVAECFIPIVPSTLIGGETDSNQAFALSYEGNSHTITGVTINENSDAGLFGSMTTGSVVANLKLTDFMVNGNDKTEENTDSDGNTTTTVTSSNVGALAGSLTDCTVTNVVAYNTPAFEIEHASDKTTIKSATGSVGGLIGSATNCTIQKSAAALIVSATGGNAGGLIGTAAGGTVTGCYSGGHAIDDPKDSGAVVYNSESGKYNVTATATGAATGIAGGLIGNAGNAKIECCYSTCSVEGNRAGGLVGNTSGGIDNCYSTGLVSGLGTNPVCAAFAVVTSDSTSAAITNSKYYEIINELAIIKRGSPATEMIVQMSKVVDGDDIESIQYMEPVKKSDGSVLDMGVAMSAIDDSATSYNEFCGAAAGWKTAIPYKEQTKLETYYDGKYNLKSIEQLAGTLKVDDNDTTDYFVSTHYGDWPVPEIFVVNTAS